MRMDTERVVAPNAHARLEQAPGEALACWDELIALDRRLRALERRDRARRATVSHRKSSAGAPGSEARRPSRAAYAADLEAVHAAARSLMHGLRPTDSEMQAALQRGRRALHGVEPHADDESLGSVVLDLVRPFAQPDWVRRREENFRFHDDRTMTREIVIHADLSAGRDRLMAMCSTVAVPVPLLVLDRDARTSVVVTDGSGKVLPHAPFDHERDLVSNGLATEVRSICRSRDVEVDQEAAATWIESAIRERRGPYATATDGDAEKTAVDDEVDDPHVRRIVRRGAEVLAPLRSVDPAAAEDLIGDIVEWSRKYMLVVLVDPERLRGPGTVRITYLDSIPSRRPAALSRRWLTRARRLVAGTLSWAANIEVPGAGQAEGLHVNAFAPDGFRVVEAGVFRTPPADTKARDEVNPADVLWAFDDDRLPAAAHIYIPADTTSPQVATLSISFYANKSGFFLEALVSSLVVLGLLGAFEHGMRRRGYDLASFDANFAAGLVVFLPALLVAVLTYRDTSRIASQAFALARLTLSVECLALLTVALPFALRLDGAEAKTWWRVALVVGSTAALRQIASSILHVWRISLLRRRVVDGRRRLELARRLTARTRAKSRRVERGPRAAIARRMRRILLRLLPREERNWRWFPKVEIAEFSANTAHRLRSAVGRLLETADPDQSDSVVSLEGRSPLRDIRL